MIINIEKQDAFDFNKQWGALKVFELENDMIKAELQEEQCAVESRVGVAFQLVCGHAGLWWPLNEEKDTGGRYCRLGIFRM